MKRAGGPDPMPQTESGIVHREVAQKWVHDEDCNYFARGPWCAACGLRWPCDAVRLAELLREARPFLNASTAPNVLMDRIDAALSRSETT